MLWEWSLKRAHVSSASSSQCLKRRNLMIKNFKCQKKVCGWENTLEPHFSWGSQNLVKVIIFGLSIVVIQD
jgi:hypothetical protein